MGLRSRYSAKTPIEVAASRYEFNRLRQVYRTLSPGWGGGGKKAQQSQGGECTVAKTSVYLSYNNHHNTRLYYIAICTLPHDTT